MTMISFKKQYVFLGVLLIVGLTVALLTLAGLDPRIGWIATGFTIGVQVAVHMLRSAELRFARTLEELNDESSSPSVAYASEETFVDTAPTGELVAIKARAPYPEPAYVAASASMAPVSTFAVADTQLNAVTQEQLGDTSSLSCACACGCELVANGGFEGLCSDCRSSRLQEGLACECDYTRSAICTCGVVKHRPAGVEIGLAAAG